MPVNEPYDFTRVESHICSAACAIACKRIGSRRHLHSPPPRARAERVRMPSVYARACARPAA
eukprot:5545441-Pleurochrysis_carterae.AAC.3